MQSNEERLERLQERIEEMVRRHGGFANEILELRKEIAEIRASMSQSPVSGATEEPPVPPGSRPAEHAPGTETTPPEPPPREESTPSFGYQDDRPAPASRVDVSKLEEWVGGNLISKIGIVITVLGVAIGAKYAIDRGWITPVMRIVFGYLVGAGLLIFAIRLKEKYERFSAVLLSGAMAIFYFISYAAYDFYSLIPQGVAFALMTGFTIFTVFAALKYDRVMIAHIGLVGAYAVPFLLSEGSGRVAFLFTYVSLINAGILAVSVARYWRSLFYSSFLLTWAIFFSWYTFSYYPDEHFAIAVTFSTVFFGIFYATFIVYKLLEGKQFALENAALVVANAFVYYGHIYAIAAEDEFFSEQLGLITVGFAAVHFGVALAIHRFSSADRSVITLLVGLVIAFITIAVPVQLEGEWVVAAWTAEAAVLFAIARSKSIAPYEWLSYPIFLIAMSSLLAFWEGLLLDPAPFPIFNPGFLTNLFVSVCLAITVFVDQRFRDETVLPGNAARIARLFLAAAAIFVAYVTFGFEIGNYWERLGVGEVLFERFKLASMLIYSIAFTAGLFFFNCRFAKDRLLAAACVAASLLLLGVYLLAGLPIVNRIAESFWFPGEFDPQTGPAGLLVRYVAFISAASLFVILRRTDDENSALPGIPDRVRTISLDLLVSLTILATLSAELLMWLNVAETGESTRLGLSILWGIYAVGLVIIGIRKHKRHIRIAAIGLFTFTLAKVFLYDLSGLGTIARTVLFVSIGILLLVASYLYNRYSSLISEPEDEN